MFFKDAYYCVYELEERLARTETMIWKVYVVLCEIMVRFGPCTLLIILNLLMIKNFHKSHVRRMSMRTSLVRPGISMSRKRKITASSYLESCGEDFEEPYDTLPRHMPTTTISSISVTEEKSRAPLVINVSWSYFWDKEMASIHHYYLF